MQWDEARYSLAIHARPVRPMNVSTTRPTQELVTPTLA